MDTDTAIKRLRAMEPDLRAMGIEHLSLFGSRARGSDRAGSDLDLAVRLNPERKIGGFAFAGIQHRLSQKLGCEVDLVLEPTRKTYLQAEIDRDRKRVF